MYSAQKKVFALVGVLRKSVEAWPRVGLVSPGAPEKVVKQLRAIADQLEALHYNNVRWSRED